MKILILVEDFNVGGAQIFAVRLANALSSNNNVYLYNCYPTIYDYKIRRLISKDVKLCHYHSSLLLLAFWLIEKLFRPFKKLRSRFFQQFKYKEIHRLSRLISKEQIEVLNSHMFFADTFACRLKVNNPFVKHFISMHGCYENKIKTHNDIILSDGKRAVENCNGVIIAAEKNRFIIDKFKLSHVIPVKKIYYGYSSNEHNKEISRNDIWKFGILSRAIKEKGWEELIEAFIVLKAKYNNVELFLGGESDYQKLLKAKYGFISGVNFLGHVHNPSDFLDKIDIGVLPSFFKGESLPNSVIEYLSEGKPVIATEIGEVKNMLNADGPLAGILISLNELSRVNVKDIENAMEFYISNPNVYNQHKALTSKAFEKFDFGLCCKNYLAFFNNELEK